MLEVVVLMSAYNAEKYIKDSIDSILEQTYKNFRLFIIDDGSTDKTADIVRSYNDKRIVFMSEENRGKSACINYMIQNTDSDYYIIQDADDLSDLRRIEILLAAARENPEIGMIMSGNSLIINDVEYAPRGRNINEEECSSIINDYKMPAHDPTMMIRSDVAKKFLFDESLSLGEGLDFCLRVGEEYPVKVVSDVLYSYRIYNESITKRLYKSKVDQLLVVNNKARRRRGVKELNRDEYLLSVGTELEQKENSLVGHFSESVYLSKNASEYACAWRTAVLSLQYVPKNGLSYVKPFLCFICPSFVHRFFRTVKSIRRNKAFGSAL